MKITELNLYEFFEFKPGYWNLYKVKSLNLIKIINPVFEESRGCDRVKVPDEVP